MVVSAVLKCLHRTAVIARMAVEAERLPGMRQAIAGAAPDVGITQVIPEHRTVLETAGAQRVGHEQVSVGLPGGIARPFKVLKGPVALGENLVSGPELSVKSRQHGVRPAEPGMVAVACGGGKSGMARCLVVRPLALPGAGMGEAVVELPGPRRVVRVRRLLDRLPQYRVLGLEPGQHFRLLG